jgi:FdhD protein
MVEGRAPHPVLRVTASGAAGEDASLPEEARVRVRLNGKAFADLSASPVALEELAVGHLVLAGRLREPADLRSVAVRAARGGPRVDVEARVRKGATVVAPSGLRPSPAQVLAWMKALLVGAELYREGGGVHTSALATAEGVRFLAADVGKVNTLDRLAGQAFLAKSATRGLALLTTGRLTGAMVERGLALGCPVLVSHSGPTTAGVALAARAGATIVGYARGGSFSVYTAPKRIVGAPGPASQRS